MLQRLALLAVIISAAYWYWQGPYQDKINPDNETVLKRNDKAMSDCQRAKAYQRGATGSGPGEEMAQDQCANQLNLYFEKDHWHSYGTVRQ